jgi:hypothetical protein
LLAAHEAPDGHAVAQPPQLAALVVVSTHDAPHLVSVPQPAAHPPLAHTRPGSQAIPHLPQFMASDEVSTQAEPQTDVPLGQAQAPATQAAPVGQALPQPPQFMASDFVSVQEPAQLVSPSAQAQ